MSPRWKRRFAAPEGPAARDEQGQSRRAGPPFVPAADPLTAIEPLPAMWLLRPGDPLRRRGPRVVR